MALLGTIGDFGLADIFQLIGIQRKSGVLTLESQDETVLVKFTDGQVVGADNVGVKIEDLLGSVLVRTGRIAQPQLDEALRIQRDTLQRLGYILVERNFVSETELRAALQTQVEQIVYRLFRWREGSYKFDAREHVDLDPNFTPISAETILMEGARMVDEWPIIERRIRSDRAVYRKAAAAAGIDGPVRSIVEPDVDLTLPGIGSDEVDEPEDITLSAEERDILRLVDGRSTVLQISERSTLGEFDTYRILADLVTRNLIEEVEVADETGRSRTVGRGGRVVSTVLTLVVILAAALGVLTLAGNRYTAWDTAVADGATERLRTYASWSRLDRIERGVRLFFLDTGDFPDSLALLVANGYLSDRDVLDPWGRPYVYRLDAASYTISGTDAEGARAEDLTLTRRLSSAQRRMLASGVAASH